ncbi:hypothetical protein V6N13_108477 [Hibiscus sabdariffa]
MVAACGSNVIRCSSLISYNNFYVLCVVVEDQQVMDSSPKKGRATAGQVAKLMNQLKPKVKGGPKKTKQGKWGQQKGDNSPPL